MTLKEEVRKLIDQAAGQNDIESIIAIDQFIVKHPELNLNEITPNGLSALWWALTPPLGKPINQHLVAFLAERTDVLQKYQGYTPRQFLRILPGKKQYAILIKILQQIEDHYVRDDDLQEAPLPNLAGIANDSQNVHRREVVQDADESVIRLYLRYGANLSTYTILKKIQAAQPNSGRLFLFNKNSQINQALTEAERDYTNRIYQLPNGGEIKLTNSDILCLIWLAANETDESLLCGAKNNAADKEERINAIWTALKDGQGYCWMGRVGRIVNSLNARHADVCHKIRYLNVEQSWNKYEAIISQEISALEQNDRLRFWSLVKVAFFDSDAPEAAKDINKQFIDEFKDKRKPLKLLKEERLHKTALKEIKKELENNLLPVIACPALHPLSKLQKLYYTQLKCPELFDEALKRVKKLSLNSFIKKVIKRVPLQNLFIDIPQAALLPFLNRYIRSLKKLEKTAVKRLAITLYAHSDEDDASLEELYLEAMTLYYLQQCHPEYVAWFSHLSREYKQALRHLIEHEQGLSDDCILKFAVKYKQVKHLDLRRFNLYGQDLRGIDFSNVDVRGLPLDHADCRLITFNVLSNLDLADIDHAILSTQMLHHLLDKIQKDIAVLGKPEESDVKLAKRLLDRPSVNLSAKDYTGATILQRILGQNKFYFFLDIRQRVFQQRLFTMPPITDLFSHNKVMQNTTPVERAVRHIPLHRYHFLSNQSITYHASMGAMLTLSFLLMAAMVAAIFSLGTGGAGIAVMVLAGVLVLALPVIATKLSYVFERSRAAIRHAENAGYQHVSSYQSSLVITNKNFERIKYVATTIGKGVQTLGRAIGHQFKRFAGLFAKSRSSDDNDVELENGTELRAMNTTTDMRKSLNITNLHSATPQVSRPSDRQTQRVLEQSEVKSYTRKKPIANAIDDPDADVVTQAFGCS